MAQLARYHQNIRPRFANPTYNSSHVGTSLGMIFTSELPNIRSQSQSKLEKYQNRDHIFNYNRNYNNKLSENYNQNYYETIPSNLKNQRSMSHSKLQNYGSSSLFSLPKRISDIDIYQKQAKNYNIISAKPIQYKQTIKKYPKYHLQNLDSNFYRKIQLERQYLNTPMNLQINKDDYYHKDKKYQAINNISNPQNYEQNIHKYQAYKQKIKQNSEMNKQYQSYQSSKNNNSQEINSNSNKIKQRQDSQSIKSNFRAKMLNNVDQLAGII